MSRQASSCLPPALAHGNSLSLPPLPSVFFLFLSGSFHFRISICLLALQHSSALHFSSFLYVGWVQYIYQTAHFVASFVRQSYPAICFTKSPDVGQVYSTPSDSLDPCAIMEKQTKEKVQQNWLWPTDDDRGEAFNLKSCLAAAIWPCGIYSRTSHRLKAVISGSDAEYVPDSGCFNAECVQLAVCFPFYGCIFARLQTTVRAFYGIQGNDFADLSDACFCPCLMMVRNEQEITLRQERQHARLQGSHKHDHPTGSQYQYHKPMTYLSPESAETQTSRKGASSRQDVHSLQSDAIVPANTAAYPQVHYLDQH